MSSPDASGAPRTPLWNKSMARYLGHAASPELKPNRSTATPSLPDDNGPPVLAVDEATLTRLGLKLPPQDSALLAEFLIAEDANDGALDADEFHRGIRRAVRISLALAARLHERSGQAWKEWVSRQFKVGYACFNRYHVAAQLQIGLINRGLPLLSNEHQSRALAPYRRHQEFWPALASFKGHLPSAKELKTQIPSLLGVTAAQASVTNRIKLHRILGWVIRTNAESDDLTVQQALGLIRQAYAFLEKGGPV